MTTAKELMHIYVDEYCVDVRKIDSTILASQNCRTNFLDINAELDPEVFCFYMAMEVMFARPFRGAISDSWDKTHQPKAIAEGCRVPVAIVSHYFEGRFAEESAKILRLH